MAKQKGKKDEVRDLKIRRATAFDVVNLSKMLIKARDEQVNGGIWYPAVADGERGEMMACQYVLTLIDKAVIYVADLNGRLLGVIGCSVDRYPWSDEWMLTNEWFYVLPQFRESDIALALLTAMEHFADAESVPYSGEDKPRMAIMLGMLSAQQTGAKDRWMRQKGYVSGGGNFVRAPHYEPHQEDDPDDTEGHPGVG